TVEPDHLEKYLLGEIPDDVFVKLIQFDFAEGSEHKPAERVGWVEPAKPIIQHPETSKVGWVEPAKPIEDLPSPGINSAFQTDENDSSTPGRLQTQVEKDRLSYGIKPEFQSFFNDPSGFFKFKAGAKPWTVVNLWKGGELYARLDLPFYSNISSSNVPPPNTIREDSWKYMGQDYTFEHLMIDQTVRLRERSFARLSFGYLESMYAGVGGEVLSFLGEGNLALGLQSDWVKKREPGEPFALKDFDTYTLLANGYYHMPGLAMTLQTQYGRFMAGDVGWLFRASREYDTGVVIGAWYSLTDSEDLQGFSRGDNEKGVFLSLPARMFLTHESPQRYTYSVAPWTRDAAATVHHWKSLFEDVGELTPARFKSKASEIKD
ncbi:MAG: YjbH domain-containing protein, partial [Pseudomonadota bacterium]